MSATASAKVHVIQGRHHVSADPDTVLTTVLGSCVAACLWDPQARIGGMNHFLLAEGACSDGAAHRYGAYAMEVLINALLGLGAQRERLTAKLFGGARMFESLSDIGEANGRFARDFLAAEGIAVAGASLGGFSARRVEFWPATGRVRQKLTRGAAVEASAEPPATTGDVELF